MNRKHPESASKPAKAPVTSQADAIAHLRSGRFVEAETAFRQIVAREPDNWQSRHLLGLTAYRLGRLEDAAASIQKALEIMPSLAEAHSDLGAILRELNRLDGARRACETAISLKPALHPAYSNLGNILKTQGHLAASAEAYRNAIALAPDYADAHANLGTVLVGLGQREEALASCRKAVALAPGRAEMHAALGHVLRLSGDTDEALAAYHQAMTLNPALATVYSDLGCLLQEKGECESALRAHEQALALQPTNAEAHNNAGVTLKYLGRYAEAEHHYRKALAIKPAYADAWSNLGAILMTLGKPAEAIDAYRRAIELDPHSILAHVNLAAALAERNQLTEADAIYGKALAIKPDSPAALAESYNLSRQMCDWRDIDAREQAILGQTFRKGARGAPFLLLNIPCAPGDHLDCAKVWAAGINRPIETPFAHPPRQSSRQRLRIGYLSADFYSHATANLITELLERHDRARFEIAGYCYSRDDGSALRKRIIGAFDDFIDISALAHAEAARRIYADGVDILVDLKGYTAHARTEILACRPAPIQVNYLGYPGTMGADFMDYILGDAFITPMEHAANYSEKIVQLPASYQPNDTKRHIAAETPTRDECGLPESGFVFCCFNGNYKIAPQQFDVWMRLLREVPDSVLWLLESGSEARTNLTLEAESRGVAPSRLVFAPKMQLSRHLARHRLADLFLDTTPINAHTTASDALWAGLPVLTCAGDSFVSRVCGSLLRAVGLPELVTLTPEDYAATALRLARDPAALKALRERLARNRLTAPLFDIAAYTAGIERAFEHMAELYADGQPPEAFAVASLGEERPRPSLSVRQSTASIAPPSSLRISYDACPLCGSGDFQPVKSANCTRHPCYTPILPPVISWNRCSACGHVFTEGYFTPEAAAVVFSKTVPHQTAGHNVEANRLVSARIVERVAAHMPAGDWLDVGFGNASLLFTAEEWGYHPVGLDLREANVAALTKLGYEAFCAPVEALDATGRFSVVSMADVLELIPMPKGALAAVHRLLRPGGVLILSMPNTDTIVWRQLDASDTNPFWGELEHYHNFSRKRLFALLEETGFSPCEYHISERHRSCMEIIAQKRG